MKILSSWVNSFVGLLPSIFLSLSRVRSFVIQFHEHTEGQWELQFCKCASISGREGCEEDNGELSTESWILGRRRAQLGEGPSWTSRHSGGRGADSAHLEPGALAMGNSEQKGIWAREGKGSMSKIS